MNAPICDAPTPPLRVAVIGAGAIGGLIAAWLGTRLPPERVCVSVLARGATLRALQTHGLRLQEACGAITGVPLTGVVSDDPTALGPQDVVIVAVKAPSLSTVMPHVRHWLQPHTQVLVAMNGVPWWFFQGMPAREAGRCAGLRLRSVDPDGQLAAALPLSHLVGCVVHISSSTPAPGVIRHGMGHGMILGAPSGGTPPALQPVAALLGQAGVTVSVSERIQRDIWFKLWGNMTMNPVSALTGATCDRMLDDPLVREFCSAVMREAQTIGTHFGCAITQNPDDRHALTRQLGAFKTSMLQDLEAGRVLEIDALIGSVREIGQHLGEPTPFMDALLGLTRLMARTRGLYPA